MDIAYYVVFVAVSIFGAPVSDINRLDIYINETHRVFLQIVTLIETYIGRQLAKE